MHLKKDVLSQKTLEADHREWGKKATTTNQTNRKEKRILTKKQPTNQPLPQLQWGRNSRCTQHRATYISNSIRCLRKQSLLNS